MATITLRLSKGSALTHQELDDNFDDINTDLETAESDIDALETAMTAAEGDIAALEAAQVFDVNSKSTAYTAVIGDTCLLHPSADTTARVFTIPANASVAYPVGHTLTFINQTGAGTLTIAITSDTLQWADGDTGGTGSRTLAANGIATAVKVASTVWVISGAGLS